MLFLRLRASQHLVWGKFANEARRHCGSLFLLRFQHNIDKLSSDIDGYEVRALGTEWHSSKAPAFREEACLGSRFISSLPIGYHCTD